jgi:GDP-4-dehydro-6-deoxy-D-mannose reductase
VAGPVLITGADGFVGGHLLAELGSDGVAGSADVLDSEAFAVEVRDVRPGAVIHLAALSSVGASWESVAEVWRTNVLGTVQVLEAVRAEAPEARVIMASSGEVYGRAEAIPTREDAPVNPLSPYAASKAAAELAASQAVARGQDVVVVRPFPQIGPGQDDRFAIGSWTRQIARLEAEGGGTVLVGDLSGERDLTDVRDGARAYALLLEGSVEPGAYNLASGRGVQMAAVLQMLIGLATVPIELEQDDSRLRPADIPTLVGDPSKLRAATGWKPQIALEQTLSEALEAARQIEVGVS